MGEKGGWENFITCFFLFCFVEGNKKIEFGGLEEEKNEGEIAKKKMEKEKIHYKKVILVRKVRICFLCTKGKYGKFWNSVSIHKLFKYVTYC